MDHASGGTPPVQYHWWVTSTGREDRGTPVGSTPSTTPTPTQAPTSTTTGLVMGWGILNLQPTPAMGNGRWVAYEGGRDTLAAQAMGLGALGLPDAAVHASVAVTKGVAAALVGVTPPSITASTGRAEAI